VSSSLHKTLVNLKEPVCSARNGLAAFRALSFNDAVLDWNAEEVVRLIAAHWGVGASRPSSPTQRASRPSSSASPHHGIRRRAHNGPSHESRGCGVLEDDLPRILRKPGIEFVGIQSKELSPSRVLNRCSPVRTNLLPLPHMCKCPQQREQHLHSSTRSLASSQACYRLWSLHWPGRHNIP
jgi:hypothetical protein